MLPIVEPAVVECVEHELARESEQIERAGAILGDERAGRGEILPQHDLFLLDGPVLLRSVAGRKTIECGREVTLLVFGITGLAQLIAAGIPKRLDPAPSQPGSAWSRNHSGVSIRCASASWIKRSGSPL